MKNIEPMENSEVVPAKQKTPVQAEVIIKAELWAALVENKKHVWIFAMALFYLSGFLALNAHLSKFGITEFDLVSTRYVLTAGNFAFLLLFYVMFVLRSILSIHDWVTEAGLRVVQTSKQGRFWVSVVAARSLFMPLFMHCFAAAAYSWVGLGQPQASGFYVCLIGIFVITYLMETSGLASKYPRTHELVNLAADVTGVVVFFVSSAGSTTIVFWFYLGLTIYINFALDLMARRGGGMSMYTFFLANTAVGILTTSLAFGAQLYDMVSQKIGGGMPYEVRVSVDEKAREGLSEVFPKKDELLRENLIYQTDKYIFLSRSGQTLRLRNDDVRLLSVSEVSSKAVTARPVTAHTVVAPSAPSPIALSASPPAVPGPATSR